MDNNKGVQHLDSDPRRARVRDPKQVRQNMVTGYTKKKRKSKYNLTKSLQEEILDKVSDGLPIKVACNLCGVPATKYSEWKREGMTQLKGKYRNFLEAAEIAEAEAQYNRMMTIKDAAEGKIKTKEVKKTVQPVKIRSEDGTTDVEMKVVETVTTTKQVAPSWQAAAWHLERTDYDTWGRPQGVENVDQEKIAARVQKSMDAMFGGFDEDEIVENRAEWDEKNEGDAHVQIETEE